MSIRSTLSGKNASERMRIKGNEIVKTIKSKNFNRGDIVIEIDKIEPIDEGVQAYVRAFAGPSGLTIRRTFFDYKIREMISHMFILSPGEQIGFGHDGSVDIERIRISNPPTLVPDESGSIPVEYKDARGNSKIEKYREDPKEALLLSLDHTIRYIGFPAGKIVPGKIGNTVTTAYPDPNPETNSCDGHILSSNASWSTARTAAAGSSVDDSGATVNMICEEGSPSITRYDISHAFFGFYINIPGQIVSAATFSITCSGVSDGGSANDVHLVPAHPASNSGLVVGDFDEIDYESLASNGISSHSTTSGVYTDYALLDLDHINANLSTVFFALITDDDLNDVTPADYPVEQRLFIRSSETTGTTNDPKLVVTHADPPPDDPTNLAVVAANGSTSLTLTWDDNSSNEEGFSVEVSDDGSTGWTELIEVGVGVETYVHNVGTNSTTKYYRVKAVNSTTGDSGYTSVESATTAPAAPSNVVATPANASSSLTLTWDDNSSDEDTFSIESSDDGSTGWTEVTTDVSSPYVHAIGTFDTTKFYRIRALRNSDSIYSSYSSISAEAITAPAAPSDLSATSSLSTEAELSWTSNSSTEDSFKIERKPPIGVFSQIASDSASPYTDTGLSALTSYSYKVRAHRSSDGIYSAYSNTDSVTTPPEAHSNLQAFPENDVSGNVSVVLMWDKNARFDNGTKIERSEDGDSWSTVTTTDKGATTYTDTGLTADTLYYYRVSAVGPNSSFSATVSTTVTTTIATAAGLSLGFLKKVRSFPKE